MSSVDNRALAAHIVRHLAHEQSKGRSVRLDELATEIGVRRVDVRHVVTSLHQSGFVDARRLRLTMTGLAFAASLEGCKLRDARLPERRMFISRVA